MSAVVMAERETPTRWTLRWWIGATRYIFIRIRTRLLLQARIGEMPRVSPAIPLSYRFGDAGDLERLSEVDPSYDESAKREARRALARGDRLVLGEHEGRVIFSGWAMLGAIKAGRGRIRPVSQTWAYIYKSYTAQPYRGRGVASGFYGFVGSSLEALGYDRLVCWVSDRNISSLRAHAKVGFTTVGLIYEVRLIRWRTYWEGRQVRRFLSAPIRTTTGRSGSGF